MFDYDATVNCTFYGGSNIKSFYVMFFLKLDNIKFALRTSLNFLFIKHGNPSGLFTVTTIKKKKKFKKVK